MDKLAKIGMPPAPKNMEKVPQNQYWCDYGMLSERNLAKFMA